MDLRCIEYNENLRVDKDEMIYKKGDDLDEIYEIVNLTKVSILTSAIGVSLQDVALALFFGSIVLLIPYNHQCYGEVFKNINEIVGINYDCYIDAMGAMESAEYILWTKSK